MPKNDILNDGALWKVLFQSVVTMVALSTSAYRSDIHKDCCLYLLVVTAVRVSVMRCCRLCDFTLSCRSKLYWL